MNDTARTWNKLLFETSEKCGLEKMETAPCVFKKDDMVDFCYADGLLLPIVKL